MPTWSKVVREAAERAGIIHPTQRVYHRNTGYLMKQKEKVNRQWSKEITQAISGGYQTRSVVSTEVVC